MMKKYFPICVSLFIGIALIVAASSTTQALAEEGTGTVSKIQYPVSELGGCADAAACKKYCDGTAHSEACLNFAEKNGLMSAEEIAKSRNFLSAGDSGPGGCKGKEACQEYCDSVEHLDECISYGEKYGLMTPGELAEAKKVQEAKARGVKLPACGSKRKCDAYCSDPANMEECITFSQEAGMMGQKELEESKKVLAALRSGAKPPACKGKEACDAYCSEEAHFEECLNFSLAAGVMDPKEAEMAKKTGGKGPGGCRGKAECDAYCGNDANFMTCAQFGLDNGQITEKDFEMMKKTNGKGPGGCKGQQECDNFCNNPDNQQTCFEFGKANGMISEDEINKMEEGNRNFRETMQNMPPEVYSCLESSAGVEVMAKFKNGMGMPNRDIGDKMKVCFDQTAKGPSNGGPGEGGNMQPGDQMAPWFGPGGCASPEECDKYCQTHQEECAKFHDQKQGGENMQPGNNMPMTGSDGPARMDKQAGPGGCTSPEECDKYCQANQEECKKFQPQGGERTFAPGTSEGQDGLRPFVQPTGPGEGGNMPQGDFRQPMQNMQRNSFMEGTVPNQPCGENCGPSQPNTSGGGSGPMLQPMMCEGENCPTGQPGVRQYFPPREGTQPTDQMPQEGMRMPIQQGTFVQPPQPASATAGQVGAPSPSGSNNMMMPINSPVSPQPFIPREPQGTQPGGEQPQFVPQSGSGGGSSMPAGNFMPPMQPSGENMPPAPTQPTSSLDLEQFLGSVISAFRELFIGE